MAEVLDYSAGLPGAAAIKRAGYIGAIRYIGLAGYTKNTTQAELDDFTRHGLGMALVFEWHAEDWRGGYNAGARYYRQARAHADQIGFPAHRPIYMAVDQDVVSPAEFAAALDYLRGARDAAGGRPELIGVYGEHDVVRAAAAWRGSSGDRLCDWFWQCRAWSGTPPRLFPGRHLYQHAGYVTVGGIQCDYNDVLRPDWGQHLENDMQQDERKALFRLLEILENANEGATADTGLPNIAAWYRDTYDRTRSMHGGKYKAWRSGAPDGDLDWVTEKTAAALAPVLDAIKAGGTGGAMDYERLVAAQAASPEWMRALGEAIATANDRRVRDGDVNTGPVS
jgi:hypothetical protein